jgi:tRNA/rRNA methyltransferase
MDKRQPAWAACKTLTGVKIAGLGGARLRCALSQHNEPQFYASSSTAMPPTNNPRTNTQADATRFILIGTSHRGNVGAAARAMKVMGFRDLVLVAPRFDDALTHEDAVAMASGATDVLSSARVVPSLTQALDGVTHLCATAMTPRDFGPPTVAPREHFAALQRGVLESTQATHQAQHRVAFAFGSERFGMLNDDVYQCHACLSIPTDPSYGSLNLAQAVQLIAYEWRQACGGFPVQPRTSEAPLADGAAIAGALAHWQSALVHLTYLDPDVPKRLMPRLQQLALRAALTDEEVHILRGVARAVLAMKRP